MDATDEDIRRFIFENEQRFNEWKRTSKPANNVTCIQNKNCPDNEAAILISARSTGMNRIIFNLQMFFKWICSNRKRNRCTVCSFKGPRV
jgi:hypothetical protein